MEVTILEHKINMLARVLTSLWLEAPHLVT